MRDFAQSTDVDGNGAISKQELTDAFSSAGKDASKVDKVFGVLDTNGDGEITQDEGRNAIRERMTQRAGSFGGSRQADLLALLDEDGDESSPESKLEAIKQSLTERFGSEKADSIYQSILEGVDAYA